MPLTEAQKRIKAKTKVESLQLADDLSNLRRKIDQLFSDVPIEIAERYSKSELKDLVSTIKNGTATNQKISRFLEIAGSLGL